MRAHARAPVAQLYPNGNPKKPHNYAHKFAKTEKFIGMPAA